MTRNDRRVAIITGGSQGIGADLVAGYRGRGWAVVANARTIGPSADPDVLTVEGDIAKRATADRIVEGALERFGRIDTLINNAGVFVSKPFTDYTAADYALLTGVNLGGFFWLTQRVIAEMMRPARTSGANRAIFVQVTPEKEPNPQATQRCNLSGSEPATSTVTSACAA